MHVVHRCGKSRTTNAANKLANLLASGNAVDVDDDEPELPSLGSINGTTA
jgi:hypothetical protein